MTHNNKDTQINQPIENEETETDKWGVAGGWSKDGVERFARLTRLIARDHRDGRWMKLGKDVLEYQEDQVATTARKGRKRSRT